MNVSYPKSGIFSLSALIVDDEEYGRKNLQQLVLKNCPQIEICGLAENIETARLIIKDRKPDIVFLDIQMPGGDGFSLLKNYVERPFSVIMVTAFPDYGIQALRAGAVDYILKPLRVKELNAAVERAWEEQSRKRINAQKSTDPNAKISVSHTKGISFIQIQSISYLEADNMYTTIYLEDTSSLLVSRPIKDFESVLPEDSFFRIHKSYLINVFHMSRFSKATGGWVWMKGEKQLPISRRKLGLFQQMLRWYAEPI